MILSVTKLDLPAQLDPTASHSCESHQSLNMSVLSTNVKTDRLAYKNGSCNDIPFGIHLPKSSLSLSSSSSSSSSWPNHVVCFAPSSSSFHPSRHSAILSHSWLFTSAFIKYLFAFLSLRSQQNHASFAKSMIHMSPTKQFDQCVHCLSM